MSWPDFQDLQRNCTLIETFIPEKITGITLSVGHRAEPKGRMFPRSDRKTLAHATARVYKDPQPGRQHVPAHL